MADSCPLQPLCTKASLQCNGQPQTLQRPPTSVETPTALHPSFVLGARTQCAPPRDLFAPRISRGAPGSHRGYRVHILHIPFPCRSHRRKQGLVRSVPCSFMGEDHLPHLSPWMRSLKRTGEYRAEGFHITGGFGSFGSCLLRV